MKKIKFPGFARISVMITQICAVLPLLYILIGTGTVGFYKSRGVFSFLFDLGMSAIHRPWLYGISRLYAASKNEVLIFFALTVPALIIGLAAARLLNGKKKTRAATAAVICAVNVVDLILRVLPLPFNGVFGVGFDIAGAAVRFVCLALAAAELIKIKKETE